MQGAESTGGGARQPVGDGLIETRCAVCGSSSSVAASASTASPCCGAVAATAGSAARDMRGAAQRECVDLVNVSGFGRHVDGAAALRYPIRPGKRRQVLAVHALAHWLLDRGVCKSAAPNP